MSPTELVILRSPLFDEDLFVHGFPERGGGVSSGKRAGLNLGHRWGDSLECVEENRRRVAQRAGYSASELVVTKHVHGTAIWRVGDVAREPPEYDGLVCDIPGKVLGAFAADCIPLLFADPLAGICGAAHAGWRGTVAGMSREMVEHMVSVGSSAKEIRVALGPSIGPCCFEVGREVSAVFADKVPAGPAQVIFERTPRPHVDLRAATRAFLEAAGVRAEHIDDTPPCTKCNPERFFSYRRDGQGGGIHMGFIGLRSEKGRA